MTASADWTPRPGARAFRPLRVTVHRYKPEHEGAEYEYLPNVRCDGVSHREGANPPTARFSYVADERARALGWPCDFESILRLSQKRPARGDESPEAAERYIVRPGSRIVVLGASEYDREGEPPRVLFDGFARAPQANVGPRSQATGFDAAGVAERLWDEPIHQVVMRDAGKPESTAEDDNRWTPVRPRVNPDYRAAGLNIVAGNCTPDEKDMPTSDDADPADLGWPCFVDSTYARKPSDPLKPVPWTLDRLARYLMWAHNGPLYGQDEQYVDNPDPEMVKKLLDGRRPLKGKDVYDPSDPATYTSSPIVLPETDIGGKAWPEVLNALLVHHGFAMCFRTEDGGDGLPWNTLEIYRKDGSGPRAPVSIPFQRARSTLDTNRTAVAALSVGRDFGAVFNGVIVDTQLSLYEISVVLAPAFEVAEVDASAAMLPKWKLANQAGAPVEELDKYRLWVCEEVKGPTVEIDGDRKWTRDATTEDAVLDVAAIWGAAGGVTRRRRPGRMPLLCRDANGKPRQSAVALSKDYAGPVNALWDGTGEWQFVAASNGWRLLPDRLGIRIDCEDPEAWNIGVKTSATVGMNGVVKLVTATAAPTEQNPTLFLRLTTVIEGDARVARPIGRRISSPLRSTRYRIVDARESYGQQYVHVSSPYIGNTETTGELNAAGDAIVTRDDSEKVAAYGRQVQQASEDPPVAGTVTIPWFAPAYRVGDLIESVAGRDLSLQANAATEAGEAPRYPYVVGVDYSFGEGGQATVLHLSDKIAEPAEEGAIR